MRFGLSLAALFLLFPLSGIAHDELPQTSFLDPGRPNPARYDSLIHYELATNERDFSLEVVDVTGRHVATLEVYDLRDAGEYDYLWDLRSDRGVRVPSGLYIIQLRTNTLMLVQRLVVAR